MAIAENLRKRMRRANKINATAAILLGEDELQKGVVTVRDMETGDQESSATDSLVAQLSRYM